MERAGGLGVVRRDLRARSARARVREDREVGAGRQPEVVGRQVEAPELHEVVPGAARPELSGGLVAQAAHELRARPAAGVEHVVVGPLGQRLAGAELRLAQERALEGRRLVVEHRGRQVEHGQLHPARDVDAHAVRDHGALGREHAADRQPVALVRIGHQGALHRRRQAQRVVHLSERALLGVGAPGLERRRRGALRERHVRRRARGDQLLGDPGEVRVPGVLLGRGHDGAQLGERRLAPQALDGLRHGVQRDAEDRPLLQADCEEVVSAHAGHARPAS